MEKWLRISTVFFLFMAVATAWLPTELPTAAFEEPIENSCQEKAKSASTPTGYTCISGNKTCICTKEGRCDDWDPVLVKCE